MDPDERRAVLGQLFFEGESARRYLYRFSFLMALSVVIATMGLLADSAAVVIGAMLLAPLITPMLASAAALLMVWPRRVLWSTLVVVGATIGSVGLSFSLASLVPDAVTGTVPDQVLSRTTPNVLDLVVALAAGAGGAYALVREEMEMALPGAAIAVAVLPPLAAVGVTLDLGEYSMARGAALLYLTNGTGIVLAAGAVFVATGFVPSVRLARLSWRVVVSALVAAVPVVLLSVPLTLTLKAAAEEARLSSSASEHVRTWLEDSSTHLDDIIVDQRVVTVNVSGPEPPPPAERLADRVNANIDQPVDVRVRWTMRTEDSTAVVRGAAASADGIAQQAAAGP